MTTEEAVAANLKTALSAKGWRQSDLQRASGVDKNTISALVNAKQRASYATLGRLEEALGLTPGMLAASAPEEPASTSGATLAEATDAELLAELTYRVESLRRAVDSLKSGRVPHTVSTGKTDGVVDGTGVDTAVVDTGPARMDNPTAHDGVGRDLRPHGEARPRE